MRRPFLLLAAVAGLGGCAQVKPPLLDLAGRRCDARPMFDAAVPLTLGGTVEVALGAEGLCVVDGRATTTYAAVALPPLAGPYNLRIVSLAVPMAVVRPRATLFDAAGQPVRTVEPTEFETNIVGLRAGVRAAGSERWLVVQADRSQLGQPFDVRLGQAEGRVQVAAAAPVPIFLPAPLLPDVQRRNSGTFSLNGTVRVTATAVQSVR